MRGTSINHPLRSESPVGAVPAFPARPHRRVFCWALMLLGLVLSAPTAWADQDSCDECKYLRCLKSTVARKNRLISVYQGMFNFWKGRTTDVSGNELMVLDKSTFPNADWVEIVSTNATQMQQYGTMEQSRTESIARPEGCGYSGEEISAGTTILTCEITGLPEARAAQPCRELADLIAQHEGMHQQRCATRRQANPQKLLTPAGKAQEEIEAYRLEIGQLQPIIDKLEKKCRKVSFSGVTIDCTMGTPRCKVRTGQVLSGSVCGDPTAATWTITPHYFAEGCGMPATGNQGDKPFENDCVAAGSDEEKRRATIYRNARGSGGGGWMCVYADGDRPKVTIRSFRLPICQGSAEQTITVDAKVSDRCENEDLPSPPTPLPNRPNS